MKNENSLISINKTNITNLIYTIRGKQVMLDSDFADLYQVEIKVFNQAVKLNSNRFPEHFRFQITEEEYKNLRSQIVTSNESTKHSRKKIYAVCFYGARYRNAFCCT